MTSTDRKELIAWLENRAQCPMSGAARMYKLALDAIREQPANEPLTLDDLSKLSNTDWVWVVFPELASDESGWYRAKRLYDTYSKSHYGKTWIAYRRPPERSKNE